MFCKNCGKQIEDGIKFCPECGTATSEQATVTHTNGTVQGVQEQKSRLVAGLLGIFLGGWGIHNFYLGYTKRGILNIVLNFLCGIGSILGLIEAIMIFTGNTNVDANGVTLKE